MLKEFLSQRGIAYRERDVSIDRTGAQDLVRLTGQTAVPVTIIDGQTIVGFDRARLEQALAGKTSHPSLGAAVADASKITATRGLTAATGAYVGGVKPGSSASRLGLAIGDIIIEVNSQQIASADDLERFIASLRPGSHLLVVLLRDGSRHAVEGTL
jgi:glutaredoxin 3